MKLYLHSLQFQIKHVQQLYLKNLPQNKAEGKTGLPAQYVRINQVRISVKKYI